MKPLLQVEFSIGYQLLFERFKEQKHPLKSVFGTSLVVQWLRFCASNAGGMGSISGQGTKIHMLCRGQN